MPRRDVKSGRYRCRIRKVPSDGSILSSVNLRGQGDVDLLLQTTNAKGYRVGHYVSAYAIDGLDGPPLWEMTGFGALAHGPLRAADLNGDGRDEICGFSILGPDGKPTSWRYPPISEEFAGGAVVPHRLSGDCRRATGRTRPGSRAAGRRTQLRRRGQLRSRACCGGKPTVGTSRKMRRWENLISSVLDWRFGAAAATTNIRNRGCLMPRARSSRATRWTMWPRKLDGFGRRGHRRRSTGRAKNSNWPPPRNVTRAAMSACSSRWRPLRTAHPGKSGPALCRGCLRRLA